MGGWIWRRGLVTVLAIASSSIALVLVLLPAASAASSSAASSPAPAPPAPIWGKTTDHADRGAPAPVARAAAAAVPIGRWQALGPAPIGPPYLAEGGFYGGVNSGRITAIVQLPASGLHPGRVVAGSAGGGIWTSDDDGASWLARTDASPNLAIGSVAVDPSNPNHLIAGTGEANQCGDCFPGDGVLVSQDAGSTWSLQNPAGVFSGRHIGEVAIDPSNPNHQFAATDGGLYVTSDGGTTWAKPTSATYTALDGNVSAVVIDPATPTTVYIGGALGSTGLHTVAKSLDGGSTWAAADKGIAAPGTSQRPNVALAISRSTPATLYAAVGTLSLPVGLYKTQTAGVGWTQQKTTPDYTGQAYAYGSGTASQGWYDNVLAVDPTNTKHVIAGGIALVESKDGAGSWTNVNGQPFFGDATNKIHPDQHALAFAADGSVWVGDDGGVFHYTPSSGAVANVNGNLNITQFYFGFNAVGNAVLAGSQDNASARTAGALQSAWTGIFGGDGGPSAITSNDTQIQFIEANQDVFVTTDAFATTSTSISPPQLGLFTPPMTVVPSSATPANPTVYYGGPNLYRTTNPTTGASWTQVTTHGTNCQTGGICVSAITASADGQFVYVGFTDGAVEVSSNSGVSFTPLAASTSPDTFVTGISVDPSNPKAVTASFSVGRTRRAPAFPHVYQYAWSTTPGTGTWTNITGNLPNQAVGRVIYDNGALVAATDAGVYATGAAAGGSTSWKRVGSLLPNVQVQDLYLNSVGLFVVTHGRGAWYLPAPADLAVKIKGPVTFAKGSTGKYAVTITNNGPADASNVGLFEPSPAGTTFVAEAQTAGPTLTCKNPPRGGTGNTKCSIATLAAGASATIHVAYALPSTTTQTSVVNTAQVSSTVNPDPVPANNTATVSTPVS